MTFIAIPAIDVREGRVVRLAQGDYGRETGYAPTPLAAACDYAAQGARWLHLVDLDAARNGGYTLQPLVAQILAATSLRLQTGGGIRATADIAELLELGVSRVVVGTVAVREPGRVLSWLREFGADRITVALDARRDAEGDWLLPVAGWTEVSDCRLEAVLERYADAGLRHLLCTDTERDGMLGGFNLDLYRKLSQRWPGLEIQASGGVRGIADITAARDAGAAAAILGRALLESRFSLPEALSC